MDEHPRPRPAPLVHQESLEHMLQRVEGLVDEDEEERTNSILLKRRSIDMDIGSAPGSRNRSRAGSSVDASSSNRYSVPDPESCSSAPKALISIPEDHRLPRACTSAPQQSRPSVLQALGVDVPERRPTLLRALAGGNGRLSFGESPAWGIFKEQRMTVDPRAERAFVRASQIGKDEEEEQEQEEVNMHTWRAAGFIIHYFARGLLVGFIGAVRYGVFLGYLSVPGNVYNSAIVLMEMPGSLLPVFGVLTDLVPISGYHRKPYIVLSWLMASAALACIVLHGLPSSPYFCVEDGQLLREAPPCNPSAPEHAGALIGLLALCNLSTQLGSAASEGLLATYTRREAAARRGSLNLHVRIATKIGETLSLLAVGFGMNGPEYLGSFSTGLSFESLCQVYLLLSLCAALTSLFMIVEPLTSPQSAQQTPRSPGSKGGYWRQAYKLAAHRSFFCVSLFSILASFCVSFKPPSAAPTIAVWAGVKQLGLQLAMILGNVLFIGVSYLWQLHFLDAPWRTVLALTFIISAAIETSFAMPIVYDLLRVQWFALADVIALNLASVGTIVLNLMAVNMVEEGKEGLLMGLLATATMCGAPAANAVANLFFSTFSPRLSDVNNFVADTPAFRNTVASAVLSRQAVFLIGLVALPLVPNSKEDVLRNRLRLGRHPMYVFLSCTLILFLLTLGIVDNFLALSPATACLPIAGGAGCEDASPPLPPAAPPPLAFLSLPPAATVISTLPTFLTTEGWSAPLGVRASPALFLLLARDAQACIGSLHEAGAHEVASLLWQGSPSQMVLSAPTEPTGESWNDEGLACADLCTVGADPTRSYIPLLWFVLATTLVLCLLEALPERAAAAWRCLAALPTQARACCGHEGARAAPGQHVQPLLSASERDAAADGSVVATAQESKGKAGRTLDPGAPNDSLSSRDIFVIVMTMLPGTISDLYFSMIFTFMPAEARRHGLSPLYIGLVVSCQPLGALIGSMIVPFVLKGSADPYTLLRRAALASAVCATSNGFAGSFAVGQPWSGLLFGGYLGAVRFCQGFATSFVEISAEAVMLMLLPPSAIGFGTGIISAIKAIATMGGPALGGFLFEAGCWPAPFSVGGLLLSAVCLAHRFLLGTKAPGGLRPKAEVAVWDLLRLPDVWLIMGPVFFTLLSYFMMEPQFQPFLHDAFSLRPSQIGLFLLVGVFTQTAFLTLSGGFVNQLGPRPLTLLGIVGYLAGMFFFGPSPLLHFEGGTFAVSTGGYVLSCAGFGLIMPCVTIMILRIYHAHGYSQKQVAGVSAALYMSVMSAANILGPPLGGAIIGPMGGFAWLNTAIAIAGLGGIFLPVCAVVCKYGHVQ